MTYLDRWCEGKPPILVMVVNNLVHEFEETHQTLTQIRKGNPLGFEVQIPDKLWRKFYWRNKLFLRLSLGYLTGSTNLKEAERAFL
jgi:hypothetical protein